MDDRPIPPDVPRPQGAAEQANISPADATGHASGLPPGAGTGEPTEPGRRSFPVLLSVIGAVVVLLLVGGSVSWYALTRAVPEDTARPYLDAWEEGDYATMTGLADPAEDLTDTYSEAMDRLGVTSTETTLGKVTTDGDRARAAFQASLELGEAGTWSYDGELALRRVDGEWRVDFSPAVLHPELGEGQTLTRTSEWEERGRILAADGSRIDGENASGSLRMLAGSVGPATADDVEELGPGYEEGDPVGQDGLQRSHQERLAGTPTVTIRATEATADDEETGESTVVGTIEGSPGQDVRTSIAPDAQRAAAQAITDQDDPTALVAVRPSTGEVVAAANVPGGYNRAFEGRYPAGSTFKIVSYAALFEAGLSPGDTMHCPETAMVGGWEFTNAGDAEYGAQTVTEAFATSCNTALVQEVAERLDGQSLRSTAERFGFNTDPAVGVPSHSPTFPTAESTTALAALSLGQGQMLTSPLHMSSVAGAVAEGTWRSPVLVTEPEVAERPEPRPIDNAETLRPMMRAVMTEGTGEDLSVPADTHGKSGTAEFGTAEEDEELPSHAWFVGFKGDLAFAVVVEGGGGGSSVAGPLAEKFLNAL